MSKEELYFYIGSIQAIEDLGEQARDFEELIRKVVEEITPQEMDMEPEQEGMDADHVNGYNMALRHLKLNTSQLLESDHTPEASTNNDGSGNNKDTQPQ